jgi:TonB-linked SusC/RagA family outer membrane protein
MNLKCYLLTFLGFLCCFGSFAQQGNTVAGRVLNGSTPLKGATLRVKNSRAFTQSGDNGQFSIEAGIGDTIVISHVGFETRELAISSRAELSINLTPSSEQLAEVTVVNVGFGTLNKKEVTTSVAHLNPKDLLTNAGNSGPLMSMQGKVPGLTITNTSAADPNSTPDVQLQGISSRIAGLGPLYVVNGVPGANMLNINQNDIESIDVLQGGAAAAIYGTRGANGVILITTKKGTTEASTMIDSYVSLDYIANPLKVLSHDEYLKNNRGNDYRYNTDWLDVITNKPAVGQKHTIQFSGGTRTTRYVATIDYKTAEGIDLRAKRKEYGGRLNVNHQSRNKLFDISVNIAPRFVNRSNANQGAFTQALTLSPTLPYIDSVNPNKYQNIQVGFLGTNNPMDNLKLVIDDNKQFFLDISGSAKVNILRNLSTTVTLGQSYSSNHGMGFTPSHSISATNYNVSTGLGINNARQSLNVNNVYNFDWTANYSHAFDRHSFALLGGYSYAYFNNRSFNANAGNFPTNLFQYNNLGSGLDFQRDPTGRVGSGQDDSKLIAFFGRLSYNYGNKYYVTGSLRREGSSKFGPSNKWGYFPGASVAWRLTQENFMSNIKWLNELKLRADYGVTGNQDFASYRSLALYGGYGYYPINGAQVQVYGPSQATNLDLRWEKSTSYNVGVDFELFEHRLSGSLNYFVRNTTDLLGTYPLPNPRAQVDNITANAGSVRNWGLQVQLTGVVVNKRNFNYTVSLAGASLGNKFVSFSNELYFGAKFFDVAGMSAPGSPGNIQRQEEGRRVGSFFIKRFAEVGPDGAIMVYKADNKTVVRGDIAGLADRQFIGNGLPKFTASMGHSVTYKNWDLSVYLRGAFGYDLFNTFAFYIGTPVTTSNTNTLTSAYDPGNKYSKVKASATYSTLSDYFLENGSYLKIDNVSLGYTFQFPNLKQYINSVRLYATARNLHTFTSFTGGDPELFNINGLTPGIKTNLSYYPSTTQWILGVRANF